MTSEEFVMEFNTYYPFERYIFNEPKSLGNLFDDAVVSELFIPSTEIKPQVDKYGNFLGYNNINNDEVYVKLKTSIGEMRIGYYDFAEHIREDIRWNVFNDFGGYEWECLYIEHDEDEDNTELKVALMKQKSLIEHKYGECKIKRNFQIEDTINLLSEE